MTPKNIMPSVFGFDLAPGEHVRVSRLTPDIKRAPERQAHDAGVHTERGFGFFDADCVFRFGWVVFRRVFQKEGSISIAGQVRLEVYQEPFDVFLIAVPGGQTLRLNRQRLSGFIHNPNGRSFFQDFNAVTNQVEEKFQQMY